MHLVDIGTSNSGEEVKYVKIFTGGQRGEWVY